MLVHCCAYYAHDSNLISDVQWQGLAWELADLQAEYAHEVGFYDAQFKGWDGSTGYHLKYDSDVHRVVQRMLTC